MLNLLKKLFSYKQAVVFVAVVLSAALGWSTVGVVSKNWELQQRVNELEGEIAILKLENEKLTYDIAYYKTDEFLELAAREKLNKRKPGENVTILPVREKEESVRQDSAQDTEQKSNFDLWMQFLFGG